MAKTAWMPRGSHVDLNPCQTLFDTNSDKRRVSAGTSHLSPPFPFAYEAYTNIDICVLDAPRIHDQLY